VKIGYGLSGNLAGRSEAPSRVEVEHDFWFIDFDSYSAAPLAYVTRDDPVIIKCFHQPPFVELYPHAIGAV
jgi:hypothetical protein